MPYHLFSAEFSRIGVSDGETGQSVPYYDVHAKEWHMAQPADGLFSLSLVDLPQVYSSGGKIKWADSL